MEEKTTEEEPTENHHIGGDNPEAITIETRAGERIHVSSNKESLDVVHEKAVSILDYVNQLNNVKGKPIYT